MDDRVLLVDGMALLFRGYYAQSYGSRPAADGTPTNAVFGYLQYLFDAINEFKPTHVVACWDMGAKTFRNDWYEPYKGNRGEPPEDLIPQFDLVKNVTRELGIPNVGLVNYEADDCLGTLATKFRADAEVFILTGDQDMLQLVDDGVTVVIMRKGRGNYGVYTPDVLFVEKGLRARQIIDMKGLTGDSSDNYPGVRGIGEKTALKLLQDYETIDGVLANVGALTKSVATKIEADLEMLHLSRRLATIKVDVPVECELDGCLWAPMIERAEVYYEPYRLGGLLSMIR